MIWAMAALLRLGVAPLLALRAPAIGAALASAGLVWAALRLGLEDRLAGLAGALLLLTCELYVGPHGARTADYDAPEALFMLAYVLAGWWALESGRARWLVLAAAAAALGVLTKGVAALLPLPGLVLFALARPRRLPALLRRWETWAALGVLVLPVAAYYGAREAVDPGYLRAVAANELGGRFLQVTERHRGEWNYYLELLRERGGACVLLSVLGLLGLAAPEARRRSLAGAVALAAASLLLVLSLSRSKMDWYAVPLLPLLAVLAGEGVSEALRRTARRGPAAARSPAAAMLRAAFAVTLAAVCTSGLAWAQALPARKAAEPGAAQYDYGAFLDAVRAGGRTRALTVVDGGFYNDAGFPAYNPMLRFYAGYAASRGLPVTVRATDADLAPGAVVASCDARALSALGDDYRLQPLLRRGGCLEARVLGDAS